MFAQQTIALEAPTELELSEGFSDPMGFYDATPNFSWKLPVEQGSNSQSAYSIVLATDPKLLPENADVWKSEKVYKQQSVHIPYKGRALASRERLYWKVKYWNENNDSSNWSDTAHFELGLLNNSDWQAKWIGLPENGSIEKTEYKTPLFRPVYLRKEFTLNQTVTKARLYITSKGVFNARINGKKIGDDRMTPGWTPYKKRIETLTYDVTGNLQNAENAIGLVLAEGWYAGRLGTRERHWVNESPPEILCQLEIEFTDGSTKTVVTDDSWHATMNGPIRTSGIYDGETYDAAYKMPGWDCAGFDATNWQVVTESEIDQAVALVPKRHFTTKDMKVLPALSLTQQNPSTVIFDMGQNMVGVPRISVPMRKGETLRIRVSEVLDFNDRLYTKNYGTATSTDTYTTNENGVVNWQPQFTFHGYRYIEISGYDQSHLPDLSWVKGIVQHTSFEDTGNFVSSSKTLNQLQSNIVWGLRGNFLDIPTDCPQRSERLGWTGDAQVFTPTALFNSDLHAFWAAWLQSVREEQFENDGLPVVIPNVVGEFSQAGWSDAGVIIPWETYWRTGDIGILEENYDMMLRWLNYSATQVEDGISSMWTVGDWLQPYSRQEDERRGDTSNELISTAYYARSIELTQRTAAALGHDNKSQKLEHLHSTVCQAFEKRFFNKDGKHINGTETQTAYLLALGFGLLSTETHNKAAQQLIRSFEDADNHLRTGFLGTPLLAPTLDKIGRPDLAFDLLFKESYPSWFFSIGEGATTMWERWNGYTRKNGVVKRQGSLNHYAYGAIGEWMYERIAGIYPLEPGYKKIRIAPIVGGPLTSARGEYESPYGTIKSEWALKQDSFELFLTIPPNTSALVTFPPIIEGTILLNDAPTSIEPGTSFQIAPGDYHFQATLCPSPKHSATISKPSR